MVARGVDGHMAQHSLLPTDGRMHRELVQRMIPSLTSCLMKGQCREPWGCPRKGLIPGYLLPAGCKVERKVLELFPRLHPPPGQAGMDGEGWGVTFLCIRGHGASLASLEDI